MEVPPVLWLVSEPPPPQVASPVSALRTHHQDRRLEAREQERGQRARRAEAAALSGPLSWSSAPPSPHPPPRALEMIIAVALPVLMIVLLTLPPILLSRWCCRLHGRRHGQRPHMRSARWRRLLLRRHQRRRGRKRRRGRMRRRGGVRQRQLLPKRRVA